MSKPDDIPQEVWDKAYDAMPPAVQGNFKSSPFARTLHEAFARAIMAAIAQEREVCAKVTDNLASKYDKVASTPRVGTIDTDLDRLWAIEEALKTASEAIRSRP